MPISPASRFGRGAALALLAGCAGLAGAEPLSFARALDLAVGETPALHADAAQLDAARHAVLPAGRLPDPKLALGLDNLPINGPDRYRVGEDSMTMRRVGLMQEFPNRAKRQARVAVAQGEVAVAAAQIAITRQQVQQQAAQDWIARHTVERQLARIDALRAENRLLDAAVRARIASGDGMAADTVAPRQEAAAIDTLQDRLEARREQAIARLARWLGESAREPLTGAVPDWPIDRDALLHRLHAHPDVVVLDARASVAQAAIAQAQAAKNSDWALALAYQQRGPQFSDMATLEVTFDLPLFAAHRQDPTIAARRAERDALQAQREATLREHAAELDTDLAEYRRLERALARQNRQLLPLAAQKVALVDAAWRGGQASLADLVAARRERIEAEFEAIALQGERQQMAARLHYAYADVASGELP
ncbi:MAG TPA: TolC family protein [Immundisolibacter sp.]|nr:TolC family protein [Immundisolibacter sp.]